MKKFLAMILALAMVLCLVACGGSGDSADAGGDAGEAWAPDDTVTVIVAYKAGNGTDLTARVLMQFAEKYIGQPVVIENLEGGSGAVGWTALSQAEPDGLTIGFVNLPNFCSSIVNAADTGVMYKVSDFAPICNHVTETSCVLVAANSPFNSIEDLVAYAKENPGVLKASTNGNQASNHIGAQMLAVTADFEYTAIPYGGTSDQLLALRQGEVDWSVAKVADFASFTSEVKVLGVYNDSRLEEYPDVPTLGELGYYDQWLGSSRIICAPAGVDEEVIAFYEDAFAQIMADPEYQEASASFATNYMNAADTSALLQAQQSFTEGLKDIW